MGLQGKIYFDTVAFIYWVEEHPDFLQKVESLMLDASEAGAGFVTSVLSIAEFGVLPERLGKEDLLLKFDELLLNADFKVLAINREMAITSYRLRAKYPTLKALDSLHLAAALYARCEFFVTNDLRLKPITELTVCLIEEYT